VKRELKYHLPQVAAFESFCHELGEQPADIPVVWLLHNPGVTARIICPRTLAQLTNSRHALDVQLAPDGSEAR